MKAQNLIMLLGVMALTSCVGLTQVTVPQSNVNIVGRDMETQRHVSYTLKKTYVFGIGGCSKRARNTNIIDELMKKANLQKNEALAYISVSKNVNTYAGVVTIAKFTASGYVVRPVGNAPVAATSTPTSTSPHTECAAHSLFPFARQSDRLSSFCALCAPSPRVAGWRAVTNPQ